MDYSISDNDLFTSRPSLLERISAIIFNNFVAKKSTTKSQIDGLRADYAMAMDQCQLMKQHIQDLESKFDNMNASMDLRPEANEPEVPYSTAIVLAKRGCDKHEIQEACGLTDSEADLILTLHNRTHGQSSNSVLAN
ncbi:MAG: DUF2802 domain-containing protein [Gammaproteobacteria bacterium]|nr:DUF2802 domain-containing protein [Gammaproteobacteria bacterium]